MPNSIPFLEEIVLLQNNVTQSKTPDGMEKFDPVTFDRRIMGRRACIRGMRLPGSLIVIQIAHATVQEVVADYPDLDPAEIQEMKEGKSGSRLNKRQWCYMLRRDPNSSFSLIAAFLSSCKIRLCLNLCAFASLREIFRVLWSLDLSVLCKSNWATAS